MERKAEKLGATEIGISKVKGKRYYVVYNYHIDTQAEPS